MKIAILGVGTVGTGVLEVLEHNRTQFEVQVGKPIEITHVLVRDVKAKRPDLEKYHVTDDISEILNADLDLVIEVMGGVEFPKSIIEQFIQRGVHVITANKDLLALHIDELATLANQHQVLLMNEASVAGGIPILNAIEVGLASNQVTAIKGILNGTTNYILDKMTHSNMSYEDALLEAKEKGYAESDPTNDVEGYDAQRKTALLARLAYNTRIALPNVRVAGITQITLEDIDAARHKGYVIKLLGVSSLVTNQLTASVEPMLVPEGHPLAFVRGANNAVFVEANAVGEIMLWGPGAGPLATASAIWSDVLQIAMGLRKSNYVPDTMLPIVELAESKAYYIRVHSSDVLEQLQIKSQCIRGNVYLTEPIDVQTVQMLKQHDQVAIVIQVM